MPKIKKGSQLIFIIGSIETKVYTAEGEMIKVLIVSPFVGHWDTRTMELVRVYCNVVFHL